MSHTEGKLSYIGISVVIIGKGNRIGPVLYQPPNREFPVFETAQANARRVAACWNFCDGISTEALEQGMKDMPDMVKIYHHFYRCDCGRYWDVESHIDSLQSACPSDSAQTANPRRIFPYETRMRWVQDTRS
jgi:hypothetical protein